MIFPRFLLIWRTHRQQEEETVAKGGRIQKEKSSSTLPVVQWIWCLLLNAYTHTHIAVGRSAIHQSHVALVHPRFVSGAQQPHHCTTSLSVYQLQTSLQRFVFFCSRYILVAVAVFIAWMYRELKLLSWTFPLFAACFLGEWFCVWKGSSGSRITVSSLVYKKHENYWANTVQRVRISEGQNYSANPSFSRDKARE